MNKLRYAIITPGILPVPATKGGAVENLIQHIIEQNEIDNSDNEIFFDCLSIYDDNNITYKKTKIIGFKTGRLIKLMDKIVYFIAKSVLKKKNTMTYRHVFSRLSFINKCSKWIKKNDYDGVLIENSSSLFLSLKWRKNYKKYQGKYFYHLHNEVNKAYRCADIIKGCNKIICVSNFIANSISSFLNVDCKNTLVVKNCIDIRRFNGEVSEDDRNELKKQYGINEEKIVLFTGRLTAEKGILELLKALRLVEYTNYKLLIVGSYFFNSNIKNSFYGEIKNEADKLPGKVIFTGFVDYKKLNKIYALADVAVLPSTWQEPAGLTIVEALASNLPLITTNSGGIPEYTSGTQSVVLNLDNKLIENIAQCLDRILKDDSLANSMRKDARNSINEFSQENYFSCIKSALLGGKK